MRKRIGALLVTMLLFALAGMIAYAADSTEYGTSGSIGAEERNPDEDDHSNWLTIRAGDIGVRIVTQDGRELIAADNYGGIYLNGDVYLNQELLEHVSSEPLYFNVANGFFYLLLVISLGLNFYCIAKIRKHK